MDGCWLTLCFCSQIPLWLLFLLGPLKLPAQLGDIQPSLGHLLQLKQGRGRRRADLREAQKVLRIASVQEAHALCCKVSRHGLSGLSEDHA